MNLAQSFPLVFVINLGRRNDRREQLEIALEEAGVKAERFPGIDAGKFSAAIVKRLVRQNFRGYESIGRYALGLSQRLVIREARRRKASSVLILEDDVCFHPNFRVLFQHVFLPEDWQIFYLGCCHNLPPEWESARIVRIRRAVDTHAVAIRNVLFSNVISLLDRYGKNDMGLPGASDQILATLQESCPAYACYPNLAWQRSSRSDLQDKMYSNYTEDGKQRLWISNVHHLLPSLSQEHKNWNNFNNVKIGFLFLSRKDVSCPMIWKEFFEEMPNKYRIFSHSKVALSRADFLSGTEIAKRIPTEWGSISLVRASRELLLEALQDEELSHFALVSESCLPARPLSEMIRALSLDSRSQFGYRTLATANRIHASRIHSVPDIPEGCWRFTQQWWILNRSAAVFAATMDFTNLFDNMFVPDEAYFGTVLALQGFPLEGEVVNRDCTWAKWSSTQGSPLSWDELPLEEIQNIAQSGAFFARKFPAQPQNYRLHKSLSNIE